MKTVVINNRKGTEVIEVPTPRAFDNYVVIRVMSAPMCTEYRRYAKGDPCINPGHEAAGEVIETSGSTMVNPGDRVIVMPQFPCGECQLCVQGDYIHCEKLPDPLKLAGLIYGTGTFAEYMIKPDWLLIPIPEDISYDQASMACCGLGPALGAGKAMNIQTGDTVLITGSGPVGLGAVIYCTSKGARVITVSKNEYRRQLAFALGAEKTIDPSENVEESIAAFTGGKGVDKVIECSGESMYHALAFESVRRKGQIAFIGESSQITFDLSKKLLRKGLTLHGIWHWNLNDSEEMIHVIRQSKDKINQLITHTFPLDQIEEAFNIQLTGHCGKIILKP